LGVLVLCHTTGVQTGLNGEVVLKGEDGRNWTRTVFEDIRSISVVSTGFGLLAMGANKDDTSTSIWHSINGSDWTQIHTQEQFHTHQFRVTAYGNTLLATAEDEGAHTYLAWSLAPISRVNNLLGQYS
jgi:hypothetical protein